MPATGGTAALSIPAVEVVAVSDEVLSWNNTKVMKLYHVSSDNSHGSNYFRFTFVTGALCFVTKRAKT